MMARRSACQRFTCQSAMPLNNPLAQMRRPSTSTHFDVTISDGRKLMGLLSIPSIQAGTIALHIQFIELSEQLEPHLTTRSGRFGPNVRDRTLT